MFKSLLQGGLLISMCLVMAACGSAATPTATTAPATVVPMATPTTAAAPTTAPTTAAIPAEQAAVEIKLFVFTPDTIEVKSGTTVLWTNSDDIEHSVTNADGVFDSGFFTKGGSFEFTFTEPGEYPYVCMRHGSMTGKVVVTAP